MKYIYNNIVVDDRDLINKTVENLKITMKKGKTEQHMHNFNFYNNFKKFDEKTPIIELNECYIYVLRSKNIGHHFHGNFFPFIHHWINNKNKVLYFQFNTTGACESLVTKDTCDIFFDDFFQCVIGQENIIFIKPNTLYKINNFIKPVPSRRRDLKLIKNYKNTLTTIRDTCFKRYNIIPNRHLNILYDRSDLKRKNIKYINNNWIVKNNIKHIKNFSTISFKDVVIILSQTKRLILPTGSGCFNYLFLDKNADVFEINPHRINSWGQLFGLCVVPRKLISFVTLDVEKCNYPGQRESKMDDHIKLTPKLQRNIENFLK